MMLCPVLKPEVRRVVFDNYVKTVKTVSRKEQIDKRKVQTVCF